MTQTSFVEGLVICPHSLVCMGRLFDTVNMNHLLSINMPVCLSEFRWIHSTKLRHVQIHNNKTEKCARIKEAVIFD